MPRTIQSYMEELSNWGRWGEEDQLGTLNLITPAKRRSAVESVVSGDIVSCGRPLDLRQTGAVPGPLHFMTSSGSRVPKAGFGSAADWLGFGVHGFDVTHLDAHSHVFWNAHMYNGRPAELVSTWHRARAGAVDIAASGIVTRGVLLDVPRLRGVPFLEPGTAIGPVELDVCADDQGLRLEEGDAVLVRTGSSTSTLDDFNARASAGLHASTLPWLHSNGVALLVSDGVNDVQPSGVPSIYLPVHAVGMVAMGLWLIDNATLEALAARCLDRQRWDFLLTCSPLPIERATGSPVNPVALL